MPTYREKLSQRIQDTGSRLCVGLDPRPEQHAGEGELAEFLRNVVDDTAEFAACFKPNIAYFEALGAAGYQLLEDLIGWIPNEVPVILDCKRGDIGTTQDYYAKAYFQNWDVDAVTLSPYLGADTLESFLAYEGKGLYLLGVTSNPGSADLQALSLEDGRSVYEVPAAMAAQHPEQAGLVVGLTNASADVLERVPDVMLLIPGLGAQGGDLETLAGQNRQAPNVINVSRGILYQEPDKTYSEKAKHYADRIASVLG